MSANNPSTLQIQILKTIKNNPDLYTKNLVKEEILKKFPELLDCDNQKRTQRIRRSFDALEKRNYLINEDINSEKYATTSKGSEFIDRRNERLNPTKTADYILEKRKVRLKSKINKIKKSAYFNHVDQLAL